MKLIKDKYKYPELQRVENELGRFYIDSEGQEVPSVTNVLSSTSDQSGIDQGILIFFVTFYINQNFLNSR